MIKTVDKEKIVKAIWQTTDLLRGSLDLHSSKVHILGFFLYKFISDNASNSDRFSVPRECLFEELEKSKARKDLGKIINQTLRKIEDANIELIRGIFSNIDFGSEERLGRDEIKLSKLRSLVETFSNNLLNFSVSNISYQDSADIFAELINKFSSATKFNPDFGVLPNEIKETISSLFEYAPGTSIYDLNCGFGDLLTQVIKENGPDYEIYGSEPNRDLALIARMNLIINSVREFHIETANPILSPFSKEDTLAKFDYVISFPPIAINKWGHEIVSSDKFNRFHRGIPPKTKGDYAYLSHLVESTKTKTGKALAIVSQGVLFRGSTEKDIRKSFIEENIVDAVVALPGGLLPSSSIPLYLLVFDRSREAGGTNESKKEILFIDSSDKEQFDYQRISRVYKGYEESPGFSKLATQDKITGADFNLNPTIYVEENPALSVDKSEIKKEIGTLEQRLVCVKQEIEDIFKELKE